MHYSDVVNIDKNKTVISHMLSQARKYILNRRTWRFFLFSFLWLAAAGLFHIRATPGAHHIR
ncbi:TPA: hypothetical protein ACGBRF_005229, partial [Escherichia coli]